MRSSAQGKTYVPISKFHISLHANQLDNQMKIAVSQIPIEIKLWYLVPLKSLWKYFHNFIIWLLASIFLATSYKIWLHSNQPSNRLYLSF